MNTLFSALSQNLREKREDKLEVHAILLMFSEAVGDSRQGTQHTKYMYDDLLRNKCSSFYKSITK